VFVEYGSDKDSTHSYINSYLNLLEKYIGKKAILLEIGVQTGGSMLAWKKFLVNGIITGIDKDSHNVIGEYEFIHVDVTNKELLSEKMKGRTFDIIIDDGSHYTKDQLLAIEVLINHLNKDGIYIIEDFYPIENSKKFTDFGTVEIIDLRHVKNRYDDVLAIIRKK